MRVVLMERERNRALESLRRREAAFKEIAAEQAALRRVTATVARSRTPEGVFSLVAREVGARKVVITDINPTRLALARQLGIEHVVDASRETLRDVMKRIGMKEGFDVGLEMSGAAKAFRDMIDVMNNGGKVAILGIAPAAFEIDWNKVIFKMLTLKGIYGREMFETWYKMTTLVQGRLDLAPLITHRIGIDDYQAGFDAMRSGSSGKVVMDW